MVNSVLKINRYSVFLNPRHWAYCAQQQRKTGGWWLGKEGWWGVLAPRGRRGGRKRHSDRKSFLRCIVIFIHIGLKNKLAAQENAAQPKEGLNTGVCPSLWKSCTPTADGKMSRKRPLPSFLFGIRAHNPVFWVRPNIAGHSNSSPWYFLTKNHGVM